MGFSGIARLLIITVTTLIYVKARVKEFYCGKLWDYSSDAEAQTAIQSAVQNNERIGLGCISTLINKNFYNSAEYLFDSYYKKRNLSQKSIYEFRKAMKNTTHHMEELHKLAKRQQTTFFREITSNPMGSELRRDQA